MSSRVFTRALCAATVLCAAPLAASAQTPSPSPSPTPPEIGTVETSARAPETLQNVTKTVFVITKEQLRQHGYRTVADAVETVPGVNISTYGATGALSSAGIRGSSSDQVLVLIDGMPAGGTQTGTVDLNSISTSGVDRIEIVEGGGSTLYGAGSVGGIINIISHPLAGKPVVTARAGSFGDRSLRIETKNVSIEQVAAANNYAYPGGTRTNADSLMTSARFTFAHDVGSLEGELSGGISAHNVGDPDSVPATFTTPARDRSVDRDVRLALTSRRPHATAVAEVGAVSQQLLYTCNLPSDPNCFSPLGGLTLDNRLQFSLRNTVSHASATTTYGIDLARGTARIDDGGGSSIFGPGPIVAAITTAPYSQSALYAQHTWIAPDGSRIYAGVRGERDGAQGGVVAPSAGFLQHLGARLALRGNYATSFRAPNATELYFPGYGTPTLRPERAHVADLTLDDAAVLGGASLTWFGEWAHDLIVSDPATFAALNVGVANLAGFTATVRTAPYHGLTNKVSVTDLYRALDLTPGSSNQNGRLFGAGPVFAVSDELDYAGAEGSALDSAGVIIRNRGRQVAFGVSPAFTRVDAFARFRVGAGWLLSLRGYNLGNEAVQEQPGYPLPGRSFALELSTR